MLTDTQLREALHISFLERLLKASDPGICVLKGGVNLRFFLGSPRYSEDMDLDVVAGSVATLRKNGYKILEDAAFQRTLRVFDIETLEINDPQRDRHTEATQRFRCALMRSSGQRLPTKVEFSRRASDPGDAAPVELMDAHIARPYRKLAFRCRHYSGTAAVVQKIEALAGRTVTQARDVFDLGILMQGGHLDDALEQHVLDDAPLAAALDALMALGWDDYEGQVVEYLENNSRSEYGTRSAWEHLQTTVFERLSQRA